MLCSTAGQGVVTSGDTVVPEGMLLWHETRADIYFLNSV